MTEKRLDPLVRLHQNALEAQATGPQTDHNAGSPSSLGGAKDKIAQLELALDHRTVIAEAIGILRERLGIGRSDALEALRRRAQESGSSVFDLAGKLVSTGKF